MGQLLAASGEDTCLEDLSTIRGNLGLSGSRDDSVRGSPPGSMSGRGRRLGGGGGGRGDVDAHVMDALQNNIRVLAGQR